MHVEHPPSAQWYPPPASLLGCLHVAMGRDSGSRPLEGDDRLSHFPVTPMCVLTWFVEGHAEAVTLGDGATQAVPPARVTFGGPMTVPSVLHGSARLRLFMVLLRPDALHAVAGLEPQAWRNRIAPLDEALDADWQAMAAAVLAEADDGARLARLDAFLRPRWRAVDRGRRYAEWARALVDIAGVGLRQVERRVKRRTGLAPRELHGIGRDERLFLLGREAFERGGVDWATLAADAGLADQSHLCRLTRRASGFAPAELLRRIERDESFWAYRLWR